MNQVPAIWKSANVLPLHKGGDLANINNYSPISKLSVFAKLMESLISMQFKDYLINNNMNFSMNFNLDLGNNTVQ